MPSDFTAEAAAEWQRITADLRARGLLSSTYTPTLVMYCRAWGELQRVETALEKTGLTITTATGCVIQSPLVGMRNRNREFCVKLAAQFGLSPASKVGIVPDPLPEATSKRRSTIHLASMPND